MTREPGGIETEALQVEEVAGVVACIHREGEHEPGQDEAPGDQRRREQCERGGSRDGVGAQAPLQLGARVTRTGNGASALGAAESHASSATAVPGTPALARGERLSVGDDEIAGERREAAGGFDDADLDRGATDADRQHPSRPGGSGDGIRCDHGIGTSVGWRGLMRKVRSWVRK